MLEFIMLVGIPGSGKTTYAKTLEEKGYHIHSSDAIREELFGDENSQDDNNKVFEELHRRIKNDLEKGISCVYDATNMNRRRRMGFLEHIQKYNCNKKCVLFIVHPETCKERDRNRKRHVSEEVIDRMLKNFHCPYYYEGWNEIEIKYDTEEEFYDIKTEEYVDMLRNFNQENSHHSLTLKEHMIKTYLYFIDNPLDYLFSHDIFNLSLKNAALYHDIGKLYTKTFVNSKGVETDEAHYYRHENYGAYMYLYFVLNQVDKEEEFKVALYAANLINWHMKPFAWEKSQKAKERDREMIGEQMYNDLILLYKADLSAH